MQVFWTSPALAGFKHSSVPNCVESLQETDPTTKVTFDRIEQLVIPIVVKASSFEVTSRNCVAIRVRNLYRKFLGSWLSRGWGSVRLGGEVVNAMCFGASSSKVDSSKCVASLVLKLCEWLRGSWSSQC